jgi:hypothetical protein
METIRNKPLEILRRFTPLITEQDPQGGEECIP